MIGYEKVRSRHDAKAIVSYESQQNWTNNKPHHLEPIDFFLTNFLVA